MAGRPLREMGLFHEPKINGYAIKAPVFPFDRFGVDPVLGPEMKSTGEVMGHGKTVGEAFLKTQLNLKMRLPTTGGVFLSVTDRDKPKAVPLAHKLEKLGFSLYATRGTGAALKAAGLPVQMIAKLGEGHPNGRDLLRSGKIHLVINTTLGKISHRDDAFIRLSAMRRGIPYATTMEGAEALAEAIEALKEGSLSVQALKSIHSPKASQIVTKLSK
jgi:carbamoyl-phosphate synthase large subunit